MQAPAFAAPASAAHAGRIGPNAVIRVAEALDAFDNHALTTRIFNAANLSSYLTTPPAEMIPEGEVTELHKVLHSVLGDSRARSIGWVAGQRTADYLLANRIPHPVQSILKVLPAALAARILIAAISRNSWTFAGSGRFSAAHGHPTRLTIANGPICREAHSAMPYCDFYAGTFERLFKVLVHPDTRVVETECMAQGAPACVFEIRWRK